MNEDTRNVVDEFKGWAHEDIVKTLDERGVELEIAIENTLRDYNMGTIVRTANAFGIRRVHVVGRKQWNKRGAMMTDKYLHVHYYDSIDEFATYAAKNKRIIVAIDNVAGATMLAASKLPKQAIIVFGQEGPGLSEEFLHKADTIIELEQFGSTRSLNVGVAAGVVMYEWVRRNVLTHE